MTPLARLPWRLVAASLGFIAAVLGAIATVLAATLVPVFEAPNLAAAQIAFDGRGVFGLGLLGDLAGRIVFPGWLVFAVLAEFLGLRSLLVDLCASPSPPPSSPASCTGWSPAGRRVWRRARRAGRETRTSRMAEPGVSCRLERTAHCGAVQPTGDRTWPSIGTW